MKTFNSGQLIFLLIVTIPLAWVIATVVVYPMNGLGLKATRKRISSVCFGRSCLQITYVVISDSVVLRLLALVFVAQL